MTTAFLHAAQAVDHMDDQRRKLMIATALLDRAGDHMEQLADDRTLADAQRAYADAALELVLIAREELAAVRTSLGS